jgi:hypothetical protein
VDVENPPGKQLLSEKKRKPRAPQARGENLHFRYVCLDRSQDPIILMFSSGMIFKDMISNMEITNTSDENL